jgi:hypothetical protein
MHVGADIIDDLFRPSAALGTPGPQPCLYPDLPVMPTWVFVVFGLPGRGSLEEAGCTARRSTPPTVICSEGQPSCTAAAGVHRARDPLALRIAPTLPLRRESSNENGTSFADRLAQPGKDVSPTAAHPFWRSLGHWV